MNYLKYLKNKIKNGDYTTGILIVITLIGYTILYETSLINRSLILCFISIVELIIGAVISISWSMYRYDLKNKKVN